MSGLRHVQHCNVNCTDLAVSLAFYRDELGFTPQVRTNPDPQPGAGFGLDGAVRWDAWMLSDGRPSPVIDLLEWTAPAPVGSAPAPAPGDPIPGALGMVALRIETPAVDEPTVVTDPDGVRLDLEPGAALRFAGVTVNVADVDAATGWYRDRLGLVATDRGLRLAGDDFTITLGAGDPAAGHAVPVANHVGIFRMAFLVQDAAATAAELRGRGVDCPDPVWLDMGPTIPIDGLWAAFFRDPDGTCLELIQSPG